MRLSIQQWAFGFFLMSTFLFGMMIAELSHFLSPFMEDGTSHYTPGMYTAMLPVVAGWFTFRIVRREVKKRRAS